MRFNWKRFAGAAVAMSALLPSACVGKPEPDAMALAYRAMADDDLCRSFIETRKNGADSAREESLLNEEVGTRRLDCRRYIAAGD